MIEDSDRQWTGKWLFIARVSSHSYSPPFPAELLASYPVTPNMNRATFNEPAAIAPLEPVIT